MILQISFASIPTNLISRPDSPRKFWKPSHWHKFPTKAARSGVDMGCSQNHAPFLAIGYITALNI